MTREELGDWTATEMFDKLLELELIPEDSYFEDCKNDRTGMFELLDEYYETNDLYEDD